MRALRVIEAVESVVSHRLARARIAFDKAARSSGTVHPLTQLSADYLEYLRGEVRDVRADMAHLVEATKGLRSFEYRRGDLIHQTATSASAPTALKHARTPSSHALKAGVA